jgi:hypothetical protein
MLTTRVLCSTVVLALTLPASRGDAQATDPGMGTWVLNVAKSTYTSGPAPKRLTRRYTATATGYAFVSDGIDAAGATTHVEFTVAFDGTYHVMIGSPSSDSIMVTRIDANTVESVQKKGAKEVTRTTRLVSPDGASMVHTVKSVNAAGKATTNVEIYDRR